MADCKICGQFAKVSLVVHRDCLNEVASQICNYYCRWPWVCQSDERLHEAHCDGCPFNKLLEDGGAKL